MTTGRRKAWKWVLGLGGALVLLLAIAAVLVGVLIDRIPENRALLQSEISRLTGLTVEFGRIEGRWRLYGPELILERPVIRTRDSDLMLLNAKRARLGLDLWASLRAGELRTGRFGLDSPVLDFVRTSDGRLQLVNQGVQEPARALSLEYLPSGHLRIKNATVTFRDLGTGRGPWRASQVNLDVYRRDQAVEIEGEATLPPTLGRSLRFDASIQGSLATPATLQSTFVLQSAELDLGGVAELLPNAWPAPEEGRGIVKVSGALRGAELVRLQGRTALRNVTLQVPVWSTPLPEPDPLVIRDQGVVPRPVELPPPEGLRMVSFDRVAMAFHVVRREDGWQAALEKVQLTRDGVSRPQTWAKALWTSGPSGALNVQASSGEWQLGDIWPLLAYLPESESAARLLALRASGNVRSLDLRLTRAANAPAEYRLEGKFADLGVFPVASWPGIKGFSGEIAATHGGGTLRMKAPGFVFDWPRLFRVPIAGAAEGNIAWRRAADGWHLSAKDVLLRNADLNLSASNLDFGFGTPEVSPTIDLTAQLTDVDISQVYKYLPVGTMAGKVVEWLDRALVGGKMSAPVRFQGPLRAFPFRQDEGLFLATINARDVTLNYDPKWSIAKQMRGTVEFRNESMTANVRGDLAGLNVQQVECRFADLAEAVLTIRGTTSNDLAYTLAYVRNSPAGNSLGSNFTTLRGHGNSTAKVDIVLPIKKISQWRMDVQAKLNDTVLELRPDVTPIVGLSGTLGVRHYGVETADLRGQWLGGPVKVAVDGAAPGVRAAELVAVGRAEGGALAGLLRLPKAVVLSGAADWQLSTRLPVTEERQARRTFNIDADLQPLAIGLPAPLRKSIGESATAKVNLELIDDRVQLQGTLGKVRAVAAVSRGEQGWQFQRGTVRADATTPTLREAPGLALEGRLERLDLDQWLNLRNSNAAAAATSGSMAAAPPGKRVQDILKSADLDIDTFSFYGYAWNDFRGTLSATQAGWDVSVSSAGATGKLLIPYDVAGVVPLTATFGKLALPARDSGNTAPAKATAARSPDPREFPAIVASASDFSLGVRRLGAVTLAMTRVPEGLRIDTLTARGASFTAEGQGSWTVTPTAGHRTYVDLKITSSDVGTTLDALGSGGFIDAKRGLLRGHLEWPGSVDENFLGRSTGTLAVELESGQILNVAPGAGRLLGLLNVTALRRRLSLDFSDLTDKGLSFDTVAGDFKLDNGDAYTDNLLLRGPAAEIGIAGRTGLGAKDYDQTAIVTGKVGSALPVAGAVVNPAVGAALFLFSQIFKKPLNGVARGYYRITGTWEKPNVERLSGAAIKEVEAAKNGGEK